MFYPGGKIKTPYLALITLCIFGLLAGSPVFAGWWGSKAEVEQLSYDTDGRMFIDIKVYSDFNVLYGTDTDGTGPCDSGDYWNDDYSEYIWLWDEDRGDEYDYRANGYPEQLADYSGQDDVNFTYQAGQTYRVWLYRYDEGPCKEFSGDEIKSNAQTKDGFPFDGMGPDTEIGMEISDKGSEYGYWWVEPKVAEVIWPPDEGDIDDWPIDFVIHYENLATSSPECYLEVANEYFHAGPINHNKGTATTGTTTITIPHYDTTELFKGLYDQNEFYCCEAGEECSQNLIPGHEFSVGGYSEPILPRPTWEEVSTTTAEDFYDTHSGDDFATPTPAFAVMFDAMEGIWQWVGNISDIFTDYFDTQEAFDRGKEMGGGIATGRAYASSLDSFLGGLPVSWVLLFYVLIATAVVVFRTIRALVNLVTP